MSGRRKWPEEGATAKRVRDGSLAFAVAMIILAHVLEVPWKFVPVALAVIAVVVFVFAAVRYQDQRPIEPDNRS
jgi:hypothetical protein